MEKLVFLGSNFKIEQVNGKFHSIGLGEPVGNIEFKSPICETEQAAIMYAKRVIAGIKVCQ
jgi:hypothetical protein